MSKKVLIFMVLFSFGLIIGSLYIISTLDPGSKPKPAEGVINVSAANIKLNHDFNLQDINGKPFTKESLLGKYSLVYFGYTFCPDICPITLGKVKAVMDKLSSKDFEKMQFVFVSIDMVRDNSEAVRSFIDEYGDNKMVGVIGNESEIDKLAIDLKVYHAKSSEDSYRVNHTSYLYLINPKGELIMQFAHDAKVSDILEQLKLLVFAKLL